MEEQICSKCDFSNPPNLSYCSKCHTILGKHSKGSLIASRYKILKLLGKGNMGYVFKAFDIHLDRYVALKSISLKDIISTEQKERTRKRILREAKAQAKLGDHPNIVIVYDFGLEEDFYYIIMELIVGNDIEHYVKSRTLFPLPQTLKIISDICLALDYAHQNNIIHRDIKPSNIIITHNKVTKIADFGIAKILDSEETNITKTGMLVGTPYYMSPEQILGKQLDGRSDIFSLGSIMYKMLTLKNPFEGKGVIQILDSIVTKNPRDPREINREIPDEVAGMVKKALEKDRSKRYQSAVDMHRAIAAFLSEQPFTSGKTADSGGISHEPAKVPVPAEKPSELIRKPVIEAPKTVELTSSGPKTANYQRLIIFLFSLIFLLILVSGIYIISRIKDEGNSLDVVQEPVAEGFHEPAQQETETEQIIPEGKPEPDLPDDGISQPAEQEYVPQDENVLLEQQYAEEIENRLKNARELIDENQYQQALAEIEAVLKLEPGQKSAMELKTRISNLLREQDENLNGKPLPSDFFNRISALYTAKNYREILALYEKDSSLPMSFDNPEERAELYLFIGSSYKNTGDINRARELLERAMEIDMPGKTLLEIARELSSIYSISDDSESQINVFLNAQKRIEDRELKRQAIDKAYDAYSFLNETAKANRIDLLQQISGSYAEIGSREGIFKTMYEAGVHFYNKKSYPQAIEAFNRALAASKDLRNTDNLRRDSAIACYHLGLCYNLIADYPRSIKAFEESLDFFESYDTDSELYGKLLINLSKLIPRTDTAKKMNYLNKAMGFYAKNRNDEQYADLAVDLAELIYRTEPQKSYSLLSGIQISQVKDYDIKGKIHYYIALSQIKLKNDADALDNFRNANRYFTQSKNYYLLGMVAYESSMLFYSQKDFDKSLKEINTAKENFTAGGNSFYLCYALYQESLIFIEIKNRSLAKERVKEGIRLAESVLRSSSDQGQKDRLNELLGKFRTLEKNYLF